MKKNLICIISGPTATGKTSTSIKLAKEFNGEIVNFDSLLFYKELLIGTARPTIDEMSGVPHHLVGTDSISSPINAASYFKRAIPIINELHKKDKIVFLVGGSGFYLQALLNGMYESKTTPLEITNRSNELYSKSGITPFLEELERVDPESFSSLHKNDHYRIRRAIEHFWSHGTPFSKAKVEMEKLKENSPLKQYQWNVFHAYLDIPKPDHFSIIEKRTNKMFEDGLLEEVKELIENGFDGSEKPLQSIGYKETLDLLNGNFDTVDSCIEKINISTRQLAKSQRTWFNKVDRQCYNPITDFDTLNQDFHQFIK